MKICPFSHTVWPDSVLKRVNKCGAGSEFQAKEQFKFFLCRRLREAQAPGCVLVGSLLFDRFPWFGHQLGPPVPSQLSVVFNLVRVKPVPGAVQTSHRVPTVGGRRD